MLANYGRFFSASTILLIAGLAGFLTWAAIGLFGERSLTTAIIAIVLAELTLASIGVIAMLLTERVTVALLNAEKRAPATPKPRARQAPIWHRLPEPPHWAQPASHQPDETDGNTLPFPVPAVESPTESGQPLRRAA